MKIIIVGGGKIGYYLTIMLKERDHDIVVIEYTKQRSQQLANNIPAKIIWGDGTNVARLSEAGAKQCDAIIAVTGKDEDNLIVCQLAKKLFHIPKTIAKVNNPKNVNAMREFGIDCVLSATDNIIKQLEREVDNSRIKELLSLNEGKAAVIEVTLPENYVLAHKPLSDIYLPESCNIISISRGDSFIIPRGKTKLMSLDTLLIVTATGSSGEVRKALRLKNKQ